QDQLELVLIDRDVADGEDAGYVRLLRRRVDGDVVQLDVHAPFRYGPKAGRKAEEGQEDLRLQDARPVVKVRDLNTAQRLAAQGVELVGDDHFDRPRFGDGVQAVDRLWRRAEFVAAVDEVDLFQIGRASGR